MYIYTVRNKINANILKNSQISFLPKKRKLILTSMLGNKFEQIYIQVSKHTALTYGLLLNTLHYFTVIYITFQNMGSGRKSSAVRTNILANFINTSHKL